MMTGANLVVIMSDDPDLENDPEELTTVVDDHPYEGPGSAHPDWSTASPRRHPGTEGR